jgi:membrane protein
MRQSVLILTRPAALWRLLTQTFDEWSVDKVPRLGAALAYYTVFSIVPLLVIIIAMIGLFFGQEAAQSYILQQVASLTGEQSAEAIKDMLQRASKPSTGIVATLVALSTLLIGASGLFGELQDALNSIWGVQPKPGRGIWGLMKDRFLSFLAVLGSGFLLLVSLVVSAGLAAFGKWYGGWLPAPEFVLETLNFVVSFAVIAGLFAMMFKMLPDARIAWNDVWVGAAITAFLFTVGKFAIGLYLGKSDVGSAFGAAGSWVILLVWVYYSAQIFLFGAEFTQVYANATGSRIVPTEDAVVVDTKKATVPDSGPGVMPPEPTAPKAIVRTNKLLRDEQGNRVASPPIRKGRPLDRGERWMAAVLLTCSIFRLIGGHWRKDVPN